MPSKVEIAEATVYASIGLVRGIYEEYVKETAREYAPVIGCMAVGVATGFAIGYISDKITLDIKN